MQSSPPPPASDEQSTASQPKIEPGTAGSMPLKKEEASSRPPDSLDIVSLPLRSDDRSPPPDFSDTSPPFNVEPSSSRLKEYDHASSPPSYQGDDGWC
jgi:hypothetical protein